ncbi:MAG TPA: hypothetical protein VIL95_03355, partial [Bacillota bacterium]
MSPCVAKPLLDERCLPLLNSLLIGLLGLLEVLAVLLDRMLDLLLALLRPESAELADGAAELVGQARPA